jgi:hypothetical protein
MMKARNPVSALTNKMALLWFLCAVGGPLLTFFENPMVVQLGKTLLAMSFGFLLFGLGLERKNQEKAEG